MLFSQARQQQQQVLQALFPLSSLYIFADHGALANTFVCTLDFTKHQLLWGQKRQWGWWWWWWWWFWQQWSWLHKDTRHITEAHQGQDKAWGLQEKFFAEEQENNIRFERQERFVHSRRLLGKFLGRAPEPQCCLFSVSLSPSLWVSLSDPPQCFVLITLAHVVSCCLPLQRPSCKQLMWLFFKWRPHRHK